jgi:hypothetical protein
VAPHLEILGRFSEDHAVAVSHHDATLVSGQIEHHVTGRNCAAKPYALGPSKKAYPSPNVVGYQLT